MILDTIFMTRRRACGLTNKEMVCKAHTTIFIESWESIPKCPPTADKLALLRYYRGTTSLYI